MPSCSVVGCGVSKTKKRPNISLHRLPTNAQHRKLWIDAIGQEFFKTHTKTIFICSLHFEESCFNRTLDRVVLRENAIPSKILRASKSSSCKTLSEIEKNETISATQVSVCNEVDPLLKIEENETIFATEVSVCNEVDPLLKIEENETIFVPEVNVCNEVDPLLEIEEKETIFATEVSVSNESVAKPGSSASNVEHSYAIPSFTIKKNNATVQPVAKPGSYESKVEHSYAMPSFTIKRNNTIVQVEAIPESFRSSHETEPKQTIFTLKHDGILSKLAVKPGWIQELEKARSSRTIEKLKMRCDNYKKKIKRLHEVIRRQKKKIADFQNIIKKL